MIAALEFGPPRCDGGGRAVRQAAFVARSSLPLSAACLVANGVREQLARLLGTEVEVEVSEPAFPGAYERTLLVAGALVLRVRGRLCDGMVVVRPEDARRLAAFAFGETERPDGEELSPIERETLERILSALVPLCNTLCGTLGPVTRETGDRAAWDMASYFDVRTIGAVRFAIGFAVTRDPPESICDELSLDDLGEVELEGTVEVGRGALAVPAFSRLAAGSTVVLDTPLGALGTLRFGAVAFARGTCGVFEGRAAISFGHAESERAGGAREGANAA